MRQRSRLHIKLFGFPNSRLLGLYLYVQSTESCLIRQQDGCLTAIFVCLHSPEAVIIVINLSDALFVYPREKSLSAELLNIHKT